MAVINCIIIEDELPASILLELHIAKFDFLDLKGKFSSVSGVQNILKTQKIDLIFLDINLPGKSGIEFARSINPETAVIFTTAYTEYAVEGFELEAVDYILKPISYERFVKAINKFSKTRELNEIVLLAKKTEAENPFIFVKCERKMVKFFLDEIDYFESQGNYLMIYTETNSYKTYQSISEMEERLPEGLFCRIHRSFLVAIKKVNNFKANSLQIGNKQLPIGRLYSSAVFSLLNSYIK
ncbi:LytR/AlgR family response regulator transcription factor [Flavobacterium hydrophilum]|uniref:DNA-binding response regulator n=1 Tax=Flavobacterium hydrophilum TaxID=2211445 RepID=A0A2V4CLR4_9FLAO|nr:LytTR family DNA-binding domain-containing protein [Flavobacterium hydrophilum]PXY46674.1 DNA-binding response regulator [Flavobacterium hydrophilum]